MINQKATGMPLRMRGILYVFAALVFALGATRQASAQWRAVDAQNAWQAYQNAFLYLEPDGYSRLFVTEQGGTAPEDFWRQAEELEVAEDAWVENNTTANKNMVQSLADGFIYHNGDNWSTDLYNDDLMWATIAFTRAYAITGTNRWLTDAENNFNTVWNRGLASNGGLYWYAGGCTGHPATGCSNTLQGSVPNWQFAIAGWLLTHYSGNSTYNTEGQSVYTWAKANLYDSSTGEILNSPGVHTCQCTYNYGVAIGAASWIGDSTLVANASNYVFNDLTNYNGTSGGYNVLPNYGQGNGNNDGFNGILMRWLHVAYVDGYLNSSVLAAAQANINKAWSERNGITTLVWNNWQSPTPSTGTYSWDDSAALAGLLDLPPTAD